MNRRRLPRSRPLTVAVTSAVMVTLFAGCSSEPASKDDQPTAKAHAESVALLPKDVKSSGNIRIVMDATMGQPFTYFKDGDKKMTGITADLAEAVAGTLGVKPKFNNTPFDGLITGLQAQRYDVSIAPMLMTDERLKMVDMVGFLKGGSRFVVAKGGDNADLTLETTCGLVVGAATGSVEALALADQKKKCESDGKKALEVKLFPRTSEGIVALNSGRLDAFDSASAQAGYIAKREGQLTTSGEPYNSGVSSMALPKGSPMAKAITSALQHLIDDGTYLDLLKSYGVEDLALSSASLNTPAE